ncbi:hypothetical protein EDC14_1002238 [Hydrogenispora ethanolica]|uniref:Uncharacterized protein n=1 Tax=Hydrogenispora ethanolica TaxID=1082276 RepID=A0A4R1SAT0_HYDET|nr:hypothetical protein EDC14_1002238 [Hydrogenispora ethanolica]
MQFSELLPDFQRLAMNARSMGIEGDPLNARSAPSLFLIAAFFGDIVGNVLALFQGSVEVLLAG